MHDKKLKFPIIRLAPKLLFNFGGLSFCGLQFCLQESGSWDPSAWPQAKLRNVERENATFNTVMHKITCTLLFLCLVRKVPHTIKKLRTTFKVGLCLPRLPPIHGRKLVFEQARRPNTFVRWVSNSGWDNDDTVQRCRCQWPLWVWLEVWFAKRFSKLPDPLKGDSSNEGFEPYTSKIFPL